MMILWTNDPLIKRNVLGPGVIAWVAAGSRAGGGLGGFLALGRWVIRGILVGGWTLALLSRNSTVGAG
jgi:hypothetical protein